MNIICRHVFSQYSKEKESKWYTKLLFRLSQKKWFKFNSANLKKVLQSISSCQICTYMGKRECCSNSELDLAYDLGVKC